MDRFLGMDSVLFFTAGFNIINVLLLVYLMYKILHKPVTKYLADRADRVRGQIDEAEAMFKDADKLKADYAAKMGNIDIERDNILETVKKRALTDESQIIRKANEQAEQSKQRAYADIEREKDKAQAEMKRQILMLSTMLTERYLGDQINTEHQNKLLDEIIEEMRGVNWQS